MLKNLQKSIKSIIFLINVFYIFSTELASYFLFGNYALFIDRLSRRLASINILYVKIFQAFALNNYLIDDFTNNKLLKFTDEAPWSYSDVDLLGLHKIADKHGLDLKYGYEVPINSGMISLVFKAYIKGEPNKVVIIKMKRKNIQQQLDDAIDNLLFFMYILSFIPVISKFQLAEVVNTNIDIIRHQTNFLKEVDNMERIRNNCRNLKYIKIPTANRQVTEENPDFILMDYIDGMKISQINQEDFEPFAKLIVKFGVVSTTIHGVTHGDLHSGNILFIKDKNDDKYPHKIGLIDFGIIYDVETKFKSMLLDLAIQFFDSPPRNSAIKLLNSNIIEPSGILQRLSVEDYNNIVDFTAELIGEAISSHEKANQVQIYRCLSKLKEYLQKEELTNLGIRPSDDFVKSQLVIAMAHGVTFTLCNNGFVTLIDQVINELFHTELLLS